MKLSKAQEQKLSKLTLLHRHSFTVGYKFGLEEAQEKIDTLKKTVTYLKDLVEFCKCGNPKADCVCVE